MAFIDDKKKEIVFKVCLYGASARGLRRSLQVVGKTLGTEVPDEGSSAEPTVSMLPLSLGTIRELKTQVHLYTVPAESPFPAHRLLALKSSDGAIFVATGDLAVDRARAAELQSHVVSLGYDWATWSCVVQGPAGTDTAALGLDGREAVVADLESGSGVMQSVKQITRAVLTAMRSA